MATTTKIYKNTTKKAVVIPGVGEIEPGQELSITSEAHYPVNLVNFPGVVDVLAEEEKENEDA